MIDKLICQSKVFKIWEKELEKFKGGKGKFEYATLFDETLEAVMIFAIDDNQEVFFVEQYWPAMNKKGLVLPGGKVNKEENIEMAALRELAEETGYLARNIKKIAEVDILPKYILGKTYFYQAINLHKTDDYQGDEIIEMKLKKIPLCKVPSLIKKGYISDARTVALCLMLLKK